MLQADLATRSLRDLGNMSDPDEAKDDADGEEEDELCLYRLIRKSAKTRSEEEDD